MLPNAVSAGFRCLLPGCTVRHYLPADAELNRRLRNVGIPKRRGQGPVNRQRYSSGAETPFAYIDPNIRPADVPCGAQRRRSLKDCPGTVFPAEHAEPGGQRERCPDDGDTERCDEEEGLAEPSRTVQDLRTGQPVQRLRLGRPGGTK